MASALADVLPWFPLRRPRFVSPNVAVFQRNPSHPTLVARAGAGRLCLSKLVEVDQYEVSEGLAETIEELDRMAREPSDVLEEMNDRLSARELQLVLVYFSQEGRDSWFALEVFEWLKKEKRVDQETMDLMVSLMCAWVRKLVFQGRPAADVADLLVDMDLVGLRPGFSMFDKVVSLYWEAGMQDGAVLFVKEVLGRGSFVGVIDQDGLKGGPAGYLSWKMMGDGDYRNAARLVIHLRESGLKPEVYSYLIAMTAIVKELNELAKALRNLKGFARSGLVAELDAENVALVEEYQSDLIADGVRLSGWVLQEGNPSLHGVVHERLLAMHICAGRGLDAERQLWKMKLVGKEADPDLYDIVLAICASQKEDAAISRLLTRIEVSSAHRRKKALTWLLRGYVKGGYCDKAAEAWIKMLDSGLFPDYSDRVAILQGLSKRIQQWGNVELYLKLCKRLADAELILPPLLSLYIRKYKLWIMKTL